MGKGEYQEPIQANTDATDKLVKGASSLTKSLKKDDSNNSDKDKKSNDKDKKSTGKDTDSTGKDTDSSETVALDVNDPSDKKKGGTKGARSKTRKSKNGVTQHKYFTRRVHER